MVEHKGIGIAFCCRTFATSVCREKRIVTKVIARGTPYTIIIDADKATAVQVRTITHIKHGVGRAVALKGEQATLDFAAIVHA